MLAFLVLTNLVNLLTLFLICFNRVFVMRRLIQDILMLLAYLAGLLGVIGLLAPFICHGLSFAKIRMVSTQMRFPLGEPEDLAVDKKDNIVVYSRDHHRLQIYRNNGNLLRGWFVYTSNRTARIHIDPNNSIHIATMYDKHYVFDTYGNLLRQFEEEGIFEKFCLMDTPEKTRDSKSNTYEMFQTFFRTLIFKTTPEGSKKVVISDPIYLWLFRWMFPTLFFCGFCSFFLVSLGPRYGTIPENRLSRFFKKNLLLEDVKVE